MKKAKKSKKAKKTKEAKATKANGNGNRGKGSSACDARKGYNLLLAYGDLHIPALIPAFESLILQIVGDLQPDIILDGGDSINADSLSSYSKTWEVSHGRRLKEELVLDYLLRSKIGALAPRARRILLKDNHFTRRLEDFKNRKGNEALQGMPSLEPEELLKLEELGWEYVSQFEWKDKLLFIHGDGGVGDMSARGSSRNPVNKVRVLSRDSHRSVVRFHTHVTGIEAYTVNGNETQFAIQLGTFADKYKVIYIKHPELVNWSHSLGLFYLSKTTDHFMVVPVIFSKEMAVINGKVYKV